MPIAPSARYSLSPNRAGKTNGFVALRMRTANNARAITPTTSATVLLDVRKSSDHK
ncbi:hypothetical protein HQN89_26445 [Paenibacillus frigoriresistens]|nr:hypothetical protein [Paenibacillus frigoriresistens]